MTLISLSTGPIAMELSAEQFSVTTPSQSERLDEHKYHQPQLPVISEISIAKEVTNCSGLHSFILNIVDLSFH